MQWAKMATTTTSVEMVENDDEMHDLGLTTLSFDDEIKKKKKQGFVPISYSLVIYANINNCNWFGKYWSKHIEMTMSNNLQVYIDKDLLNTNHGQQRNSLVIDM